MNKWDYIHLISQRGSHYGYDGGVFDLLTWSHRENTMSVTLDEAKAFWESWPHSSLLVVGGSQLCVIPPKVQG